MEKDALVVKIEKLVGSFSNCSIVKAMDWLFTTRWINYSGLAHHLCRIFGLVFTWSRMSLDLSPDTSLSALPAFFSISSSCVANNIS
jgi:hypothetical protein